MNIEDFLKTALDKHASDLHIVPGMAPLLRIEGELVTAKDYLPITPEETSALLNGLMNQHEQKIFEKERSIDMALFYPQLGNFRINILHQLHGIEAVVRIVPERVPTFDELSLPQIMKKLLVMPYGLILVTGATGSGKSTTLASMVDFINTYRGGHIITIEDPIEYIHTNKKCSITQLQVGRDTRSFSAALRHSLRQDPNVIMLGEMRDLKSIRLALTAAETGHLVLSTLHASSASVTINRIVDIFPLTERDRVRNMLADTIQGVLCQTLVRRATSGRVAAFEVMLATPAIRHLISQGRQSHIESTIQTSGDLGMFTMEHDLKELAAKGTISQNVARAMIAARDTARFADKDKKI